LLLLFKYANHKNKRSFVSTANEALVGTLMTIGDVNNIFPIVVNINTTVSSMNLFYVGLISAALSCLVCGLHS